MEQLFIESLEEMEQILREGELGYLGLLYEDEPYVVPVNYAYADGRILFHCAVEGQKLDAIRSHPRVCFTVGRQVGDVLDHTGAPCHMDADSVICYGTARSLDNLAERETAINSFNRRYRPTAPDVAKERIERCMVVEIAVERMTGRRERARRRTYWCYSFGEQ